MVNAHELLFKYRHVQPTKGADGLEPKALGWGVTPKAESLFSRHIIPLFA